MLPKLQGGRGGWARCVSRARPPSRHSASKGATWRTLRRTAGDGGVAARPPRRRDGPGPEGSDPAAGLGLPSRSAAGRGRGCGSPTGGRYSRSGTLRYLLSHLRRRQVFTSQVLAERECLGRAACLRTFNSPISLWG